MNRDDFREFLNANKERIYKLAEQNNAYSPSGRPAISRNDEWRTEHEWDKAFNVAVKERMRGK